MLEPEDLIDLLEQEGYRELTIQSPLREIVFGRRVKSLDHPDWALTVRVYTGIIPEPETQKEEDFRRGYHDFGTGRYLDGTLPGEIRAMLFWRAPNGKPAYIGGLDTIRPNHPDPERALLDQLHNWMTALPRACSKCGSPMRRRKPKHVINWEWYCPDEACGNVEDSGTPFLAEMKRRG